MYTGDKLRLTSDDGKTHKVLDSPGTAAVGFSRDGATLYAVRRNSEQKWELAELGVPDGREKKITPLGLPASVTIEGFSLHPDGKSFATSVARPVTISGCSKGSPNLADGVSSARVGTAKQIPPGHEDTKKTQNGNVSGHLSAEAQA